MKVKGLTLSIIFEAQSANYGEGFGNIQVLKKLSRGDGSVYTYISRQALRYEIIKQLGWDNTPVEAAGGKKKDSEEDEAVSSGKKKVVQFAPAARISDFPEIDLFGYMKTNNGQSASTRSAVVRLSHAVALESYNGEMDYLTNMALTSRGKGLENSISQSEIHKSFYSYTVTVDLDRVGREFDQAGNIVEEIDDKLKIERIKNFLNALLFLNRDIKGRCENLNPVFAIGGIYERKNPYFEGRLKLKKCSLDTKIIKEMLKLGELKKNTEIGILDGIFANSEKIKEELVTTDIPTIFASLNKKVEEYYNESGKN